MSVSPAIQLRLCFEDLERGRLPLFDAVEALLKLAEAVPALEGDRDVAKLAALLSSAEHLPIGAAREHWQAEALHQADRELMELERRHRDEVLYAGRRIVAKADGAS